MEYLFVYGTLMQKCTRNEWSAFLLKNARYLGEAKIRGDLYKVDYYPGLIKSENWVYGELFEIQDSSYIFHYLDQYEDYRPNDPENSLYTREKSEVWLTDNSVKSFSSWVYYYKKPFRQFEKYPKGRFIEE
ncbi:gamma-glutamylcyclotransferase family protein [Jiulongibacter sediminis]|uniref:Gamma-glutamylcyclotransferase AIG2-like domain-containing protein n=1 Tax=Jiulongibacter sediminis TaxID=1605367 RepID=A0A0P7BYA7_9BACT|nr:gamma-glutamylcyclotransferase family protein [Jiulongibacter sediminis]KPM49487.1 hypothetical protein AFM12_02465 [Jiulongibacter sediminis]